MAKLCYYLARLKFNVNQGDVMFFLSVKTLPREEDMWPFHTWKDYAIGIGVNLILFGLVALGMWLS